MSGITRLRLTPKVGSAVAAVLLLLAMTLYLSSGPEAPTVVAWYYDLETGEHLKGGTRPPVAHTVMARVFSCGDCGGELFVGYLEMSNPNPAPPSLDQPDDSSRNTLISAVPSPGNEPRWIPGNMPAARAIVETPLRRCGQSYRECLP